MILCILLTGFLTGPSLFSFLFLGLVSPSFVLDWALVDVPTLAFGTNPALCATESPLGLWVGRDLGS